MVARVGGMEAVGTDGGKGGGLGWGWEMFRSNLCPGNVCAR